MSADNNGIAGQGANKPIRRKINPLLLLGEPDPGATEVRALGATGMRRPSQEELVETGEFSKKLPPLPEIIKSEPTIETTDETVETDQVEPLVSIDENTGSDSNSEGSNVIEDDEIEGSEELVVPVVPVEPDVNNSKKLPSLPTLTQRDDVNKKAVRGINPLLLPGGGGAQGARRLPNLPDKPEAVVDTTEVVETEVSSSEPVVESDELAQERLSPIGDNEQDSQDDSIKNVSSDKKSVNKVIRRTAEKPDEEVDEQEDKPKRINPLFLVGEEKELAEINPHLHGQRRLRAPNSAIFLPDNVERPTLPKRDTSVVFNPRESSRKEQPQYIRKLDGHVETDDWTEDNYDTDTSMGLGGEKEDESAARKTQYSKGFHLTSRDIVIIRFLARYRYAYAEQLARLVDTTPRNMSARLRVLEKRGILRKENITDRQYLWTSKKGGNVLADINFAEIRKGQISYITLPHTLAIVNLGVEFEREKGGKDLLGEAKNADGEWEPPMDRWKYGIWGNPDGKTLGYMTITEREIRQGQLRTRGNRDAKEMREMVHLVAKNPDPVEFEEGQEGLFVIYGQASQGGEHIPDLVVVKDRDEITGKPQHIAIEMELTHKQPADWKRILRNFRDNGEMYDKIVYFTHKRSIATSIQQADEEVGLGDRLIVRKYIPTKNSIPFWG